MITCEFWITHILAGAAVTIVCLAMWFFVNRAKR